MAWIVPGGREAPWTRIIPPLPPPAAADTATPTMFTRFVLSAPTPRLSPVTSVPSRQASVVPPNFATEPVPAITSPRTRAERLHGVAFRAIGRVAPGRLRVVDLVDVEVEEMRRAWCPRDGVAGYHWPADDHNLAISSRRDDRG